MSRIIFLVPAYNEGESLRGVIRDLREHHPTADIAVINDGSCDGTEAIARAESITLLNLPFNLGIGAAVQTGLLFAARNDYDIAVQFDGDGQHRADQVAGLLEKISSGEWDVAIGSRFLQEKAYRPPLGRRIGIAIFQVVNRVLVGQTITDNTSGFRAYSRGAIAFLAEDYPHDYPEPESIVSLIRNDFRVIEVPVEMRTRQGGESSITFWRSIYYMLKVLTAMSIGATRPIARRRLHEHQHPGYLDNR
jgi:glycosyltransferase involved in cell wall biosynthesis